MSMRSSGPVIPLLIILALPGPDLRAQDLSFHDVGARAAGLGGAFTAQADDITAIFYNPAGLAFLDGLRIKASLNFASRSLRAVWPETGQDFSSSPNEVIGNFFLSWRPAKGITLGAGYFSPANFDSVWPSPWSGEEFSAAAKFTANIFRPVVAVEPLKGLALGAALDLLSVRQSWDHRLPFVLDSYSVDTQVLSRHELSGQGLGFAAGFLWKIFPRLQIGARYQKSTAVEMGGRNTFLLPWASWDRMIPTPYQSSILLSQLMDMFYDTQEVAGKVTLPREIACGILVKPFSRVSLDLDLHWQRWSELGRWEFSSVNADGDLAPLFTEAYREFYGIAPDYGTQGLNLAVRDSNTLKAGLEYRIGKWFAARAGFARLKSSVEASGRTPLYPDPAFKIYSLGAGYEGPVFSIWDEEKPVSRLSFDVFIRYAAAGGSASELPGLEMTYHAERWVAGVGMGFIF